MIALQHFDPRDERNNLYGLSREPLNAFNHTPVHELNLQSDEEFLVIKAKRRPLLVVSEGPDPWSAGGGRARDHVRLCAPLHSFHDDDPPELRARVEALEYPWWVHLPPDSVLQMREGFLRLDRLQVVVNRLLEPMTKALTAGALYLVSEWLRYHVTGEIESLFAEYRTAMLESLA